MTAPGATTFDVRGVLDGTVVCAGAVTLTPGSWLLNYPVWTATAGTHTLRWDLDYNNSVPETNESNNSATKTFTTANGTANPLLPMPFPEPPNASVPSAVSAVHVVPISAFQPGVPSASRRPDGQ